MLKISSVLIGVHSLIKARPFYEKVLGITLDEFRPPFSSFKLDNLEFNLEENAPARHFDWAKLYVGERKQVVLETDDLAAFLAKVKLYGG